jgi:hypothetical protein
MLHVAALFGPFVGLLARTAPTSRMTESRQRLGSPCRPGQ